jgi:hypothetical protein
MAEAQDPVHFRLGDAEEGDRLADGIAGQPGGAQPGVCEAMAFARDSPRGSRCESAWRCSVPASYRGVMQKAAA